jgi:hypothetical protein
MEGRQYKMSNKESYEMNVANDWTQQEVAARRAAYDEYVVKHGAPPHVEPSGVIVREVEGGAESGVDFRAWDAEL